MTQNLFWSIIMQPSILNLQTWPDRDTKPSVSKGFLTEAAARDFHNKQYGKNQYWDNPSFVEEPLGDPTVKDQFYVVVDCNGNLETGSYSSVSPKLYRLKDAKAVAKKNDRSWSRAGTSPSRILPVTLTYGAPVG